MKNKFWAAFPGCFLFAVSLLLLPALPCAAREEEPEPTPAREVVENAARAMERAAASRPLEIRSFGGRFTFYTEISEQQRRFLHNHGSAVFRRDFSGYFEGSGSFLMSTEKVDNNGEEEKKRNLFFEVSSREFSFLLLRRGEEVTLVSPQLGVLLNDRLENIAGEIERNREVLPLELPSFDLPWLTEVDMPGRLKELAGDLRLIGDALDPEKKAETASYRGHDCYRVSLPREDGGRVTIKVYRRSSLPALLWVVSPGGEVTTMYAFPRIEAGETMLSRAYLPEEITMVGRRDGRQFEFRASRLRYNRLVSANDFALHEMNMSEILPFLFIRALTGD